MLNIRDPFAQAREYITVIKIAMNEARLSRAEQSFQWRAVFRKLADELEVGAVPKPHSPQEMQEFFQTSALLPTLDNHNQR